jgi:hypothetical protein
MGADNRVNVQAHPDRNDPDGQFTVNGLQSIQEFVGEPLQLPG